jgi:hypothetical protein
VIFHYADTGNIGFALLDVALAFSGFFKLDQALISFFWHH